MSLVRIPNQPISFYEQDECVSTSNDFFQLVKEGDLISFQFKIDDDCGGAELVIDGGFTDCPGDWEFEEGWDCGEATTGICVDGTTGSLIQNIVLPAGTFSYKFTFSIFSYVAGALYVNIGAITYGLISANGTYTFYAVVTSDGATPTPIEFEPFDNTAEMCLDDVSLIQISATQYFVNLFDSDGNFIVGENSIDDLGFFTLYKNFLTVNVETFEIPDGCYYLCVNELCNCVTSLEAKTIDICAYDWVEGIPSGDGQWEVEGVSPDCSLGFGPGGEGDTDSISTTGIICEGFSYIILFNLEVTNARVKFVIGTFESIWYDTTGSYTLSGAAITVDSGTIEIIAEATSNAGSAAITDILVQYNGIGDNPISGKFCSQPIQLYSDDSQFCTKLLSGCNNSDAFGFGFNDSTLGSANFNPQSRVLAKLFPGNYNQSFSIEEDSIGKRSVKYAQSRKAKRLRIIDTAEYLWDWIAIWIGLDKMMIDGVDYVIEEDGLGDVAYNKFQTLGTGDIQVGVKTQNMYKTNNSDEEPCEA